MNMVQQFWDENFLKEESLYGLEANNYIKEHSTLFPKQSKILCLGEGEGRNALYLADLGHIIEAIDISSIAIKNMEQLLSSFGHDIDTKHEDLTNWQIEYQKYDVITATYLHLPSQKLFHNLLDKIILSLKTNGYFIGEFFEKKQIDFSSGGPKNIDMLYCIKELQKHLEKQNIEMLQLSNQIIKLDEGIGHQGDASIIRILFKKL